MKTLRQNTFEEVLQKPHPDGNHSEDENTLTKVPQSQLRVQPVNVLFIRNHVFISKHFQMEEKPLIAANQGLWMTSCWIF